MSITKGLDPKAVWEYVSRTLTNHIETIHDAFLQIAQNRGCFYDDFGDNKLSDRDNFVAMFESIFGVGRPEWTVEEGSPSVSDGELILPAGNTTPQRVSTPCKITSGVWEIGFKFMTAPSSGSFRMSLIYQNGSNYYILYNDILSNKILLHKREAGSISDPISHTGAVKDTDYHVIKVTRDSSGNWEIFLDGTSIGTTTDSFVPTPTVIDISNYTDAEVHVDYVKVY